MSFCTCCFPTNMHVDTRDGASICPGQDPAIDALRNSGLLSPGKKTGTFPIAKKEDPIMLPEEPEVTPLSILNNKLDSIMDAITQLNTRLDKMAAFMAKQAKATPAKAASGNGGGSKGGFKRGGGKKEELSEIQTADLAISKVYEDKYDKGSRFKLMTVGGPAISTWDAASGRLANQYAGSGNELRITWGKNANGYATLSKLEEIEGADNDGGYGVEDDDEPPF